VFQHFHGQSKVTSYGLDDCGLDFR